MKFLISVAIFWFSLLVSAHAQPEACHAFAASPVDPDRKGVGVSYAKIDGIRATAACKLAVEKFPEDGQLWFQYGRALEKLNRVAEAVAAYQTGAHLGNVGAMNNLGELYRDGKGVVRDLVMADVLFEKASTMGNFPEAQQNLNALISKESSSVRRIIPIQFRGKFATPTNNCDELKEAAKYFDGEFMGIKVSRNNVFQYMELVCSVLNLTLMNPRRANVILKCTRNSPDVFLSKAELRPNALVLGLDDDWSGGWYYVRCPNWTP